MKLTAYLFFIMLTSTAYGQSKYDYIHFNKLTEVIGTDYMIASIDNRSKISISLAKYLLFIDTKTGSSTQIDIPADGSIKEIKQVKIDSLGINKILIVVKSIDLDEKHGIDYSDPKQLLVLSPDGKEKTQITDNDYFLSNWVLNRNSGAIVITGYYDTNKNGKCDKKDKSKIIIYDLKSLREISKI